MVVTKLRLELPNIAEVAVYLATQYVQTTTYIVLYGSASLHQPISLSPTLYHLSDVVRYIGESGQLECSPSHSSHIYHIVVVVVVTTPP